MKNTEEKLRAEISRLKRELAESRQLAEENRRIAEVASEEIQNYKVMEQEFHRMLNSLSNKSLKQSSAEILEFPQVND